jgi:hypothetical protein
MPYVVRNEAGEIEALRRDDVGDGAEELPIDHPDVVAFLGNGSGDVMQALSSSDADMARITEDLIDCLIAKNIINFTDLPDAAQSKLITRRKLRAKLSPLQELIDDEEDFTL